MHARRCFVAGIGAEGTAGAATARAASRTAALAAEAIGSGSDITDTTAVSATAANIDISHITPLKPFSTSTALAARKKDEVRRDRRVTLIRYFLYHPLTPSPLRFSRNRYLRHWTIHRAWQLYLAKRRRAHKLELERQFRAMHAANEELRTGAGDGGWLFKRAMSKHRLYKGPVPIEYGRLQTETPSKFGWNYEWKRPEA
ncbi:hypothetical protein KEM52_006664 [Ascosphaera acerosa]|nr:hypothetical protein KEM52_006664 [Ascosphaera acerosa]